MWVHPHARPTHLFNHLSFHSDELFSLVTDFEGWGDARDEKSKVDQVFRAKIAMDEPPKLDVHLLNKCQHEIKYIMIYKLNYE